VVILRLNLVSNKPGQRQFMKNEKKANHIRKLIFKICHIAHRAAGGILIFLVIVLVADALGRFIGKPVTGSYEIVQYGFALIVAFSVAYTQLAGGHISIELIFGHLPAWLRRVFTFSSQILTLAIFSLITCRLCADSIAAYRLSEESSTVGIPIFIFELILAVGFALLVLVTAIKLIFGEDQICHS
jgi:TRAP-type mannitol/chloroaromatic compound transport system permease small subunit